MLGRVQHHLSVRRVKRRLKECAVYCLEKRSRIDSLPRRVNKRLAERVNHGADEEVAAEFYGVRFPWVVAHNGDTTRKGLQQRTRFGNRLLRARDHGPQAAFFSDIGTAKDRRGDKFVSAAAVLPCQALAQCNA